MEPWLRRRGLVPTVVSAAPSIPPEGGTATARGCYLETKEHGPCAKGLRFAGAGAARGRLKAEEGKSKWGHMWRRGRWFKRSLGDVGAN